MDKIKKHLIGLDVLILMVLLITLVHRSALAQADTCSKPKVAVIMETYKEKEFINHLNEQYPSQPKGSWLYQIQEKVLEELRMNSPGTQFIPASGGIPKDCDYYFEYIFTLIGAGQKIEIWNHVTSSEYTAYYMSSKLAANSACKNQNYILNVEITGDDRDIDKTIERNIAAHGNIGDRIRAHEESHRVPSRGPEIKVSQDREYVSPLEEERKLKIKIDVTNCRGEPVFDKYHGQYVTLSKEKERGELECTRHTTDVCRPRHNKLELIIQRPQGTSAIYNLKKGVAPDTIPITIIACGIDKKAVKETKIQIHGLELKVKPEKKEIFPGEKTRITVTLSEVDVDGTKQPVAGKKIHVDMKGLVNGHIQPSGDVTADQNGKAVLTYDSGDKDKKVVVKARFQPKDYPDSVKDEGAVVIAHYEGQLQLSYSYDDDCEHEDATVLVRFGKAKTSLSLAPDKLGTYYPVESVKVVKASAIYKCGDEVKTGDSFHIPTEPWIQVGKGNILFLKDNHTGKITDVIFSATGCRVEFTWSDGYNEIFSGDHTDEVYKVTGGDGLYNLTGSEGTFHWRVHMRKSH